MVKKFGSIITQANLKFRADRLIYEEDYTNGLEAATRAGADVLALAKARVAIGKKARDAAALLKAVPDSMKGDPAYLFAQIELFRRTGKAGEAAALLLKAPKDTDALVSPDEWWTERRLPAAFWTRARRAPLMPSRPMPQASASKRAWIKSFMRGGLRCAF